MRTAATSIVIGDPAAILDRHAVRRAAGIATVSLLVGPIEAGGATWERWAAETGRCVVRADRPLFPTVEWVRAVAERVDLPVAAVHRLAGRVGRDPAAFLDAWRVWTPGDRERFWAGLAPEVDDDVLRSVADLDRGGDSRDRVGDLASDLGGERVIPVIARLAPAGTWPGVLFVGATTGEFFTVGDAAVTWAMRLPALPVAVAVPAGVWDDYLATTGTTRTRAILREGEIAIPVVDAAMVERTLALVGARGSARAILAAGGGEPTLLESAMEAARANANPPRDRADGDRARSAAERFLFLFLESLPETAGRFELNGALDFRFGPRPAEVDLICRSPRIAIELDGYFHFLAPDDYRRDRAKDWELQRRGFVVLRFLAEDVVPQLETIRDRILDALAATPPGAHP